MSTIAGREFFCVACLIVYDLISLASFFYIHSLISQLRWYGGYTAIDRNILKLEIFYVINFNWFLYSPDGTVNDLQVFYRRFFIRIYKNALLASFFYIHIFYPYISDGWHKISRFLIKHVYMDCTVPVSAHLYIFHKYILDYPTPAGTGLQA